MKHQTIVNENRLNLADQRAAISGAADGTLPVRRGRRPSRPVMCRRRNTDLSAAIYSVLQDVDTRLRPGTVVIAGGGNHPPTGDETS